MQGIWDYVTGLVLWLICFTILGLVLQVGGC